MPEQFFGRGFERPDPAAYVPTGSPPPLTEQDIKTWVWAVHILHALTFVTGITGLAAVIIAYIRKPDTRGTIYESHMVYAIRSFWLGVVMTAVALVLCFVLVGIVMFMLIGVWWLVRVIRPFIALADGRAIANPTGFL